jgi:hypothetical protein
MILSTECFDTFQLDIIGPLHQSRELPYIFTCVDTNSKYSFAIPIKSTQDEEICRCLELICFANNGFPRRVQANSALFTEVMNTIRVDLSQQNHPSLDGFMASF